MLALLIFFGIVLVIILGTACSEIFSLKLHSNNLEQRLEYLERVEGKRQLAELAAKDDGK